MKNFITLEGSEGVGKSTQVRLLKEYCQKNGIDAVFTREPGGSKIAEDIREIILSTDNGGMSDVCEALLYSAARAQHLADVVLPALEAGKLVLCDRFIDSTFAYQGYAKGLGTALVDELNRIAIGDCVPDLTIFLDLAPEESFARKGGADKTDRLELLSPAFHRRVYEGYRLLAEREPERFVSVRPTGTKYETAEKVYALLAERGIIPI